MRIFTPALVLLLLALPAQAAEKPAEKSEGKPAEATGAPGTNIDMPFLMAPMTGADGKLTGYAYISCRVTANSDTGANDIRDKIAFIQDAYVRDINGTPVALADDPAHVDMTGLQVRLLADTRKVVGAKVKSLVIVQVQIAPLHPVQTPAVPPPPESAPVAPPAAAPAAKPAK